MKTKEEILNHLCECGYKNDEISKIMGYMVGANLKKEDEIVKYRVGEHTFKDFLEWVNKKKEENVFLGIALALDFLRDNRRPLTEKVKNDLNEKIEFLMANKDFLSHCMEYKRNIEQSFESIEDALEGIFKLRDN